MTLGDYIHELKLLIEALQAKVTELEARVATLERPKAKAVARA